MFTDDQPTVFLLGAGASWHYGFPTGEMLVKEIRDKGAILARFYRHSFKVGNPQRPKFFGVPKTDVQTQWKEALERCQRLNKALQEANPLVIDYFLGLNPDLQEIGKLLIAWVLLERDSRSRRINGNINRENPAEDDWCRFITHQLGVGCKASGDLHKNKVSFVTFNYDTSLETRLHSGLRHHELFSPTDIEKFLGGSRIIHVYGRLANSQPDAIPWSVEDDDPLGFNESNWGDYHGDFARLLDAIHDASTDLRVIDPDNKDADAENIVIAKTQIVGAKRLFALGYGFDENNNQRLNLSEAIRQHKKRFYFTNFENNRNVNKRVSKLISGSEELFRSDSNWIESGLYERSARSVYDAFARDFDL
ncbi:hypothetical protein [Bradyrhizobium sp. UFLA05-112]